MTYDDYKEAWSKKTTKQVEKELKSYRAYCDKNSSAYAWHGKGITPPGSVADGDKIIALSEILRERKNSND